MSNASCTECSAEVEIKSDAVVGEITRCPDCGVDLEVVSVDPPVVELAPEIEEDWGE